MDNDNNVTSMYGLPSKKVKGKHVLIIFLRIDSEIYTAKIFLQHLLMKLELNTMPLNIRNRETAPVSIKIELSLAKGAKEQPRIIEVAKLSKKAKKLLIIKHKIDFERLIRLLCKHI